MSRSIWRRLAKPLAVLIAGAFLSGCSGEETIPLKKLDPSKDSILDTPKEPKTPSRAGPSSKIKGDPSGVNRQGLPR
jgi:hypothetical protein